MKNKGFTLVELLAVIVLLGIIAIIAIPVITSQVEEARTKSYNTQIDYILSASKKYASEELIGYTKHERSTYDIVFVLDVSTSMNGACSNPSTAHSLDRLKNSVSAINEIMKKYMVDVNNRAAFVTFYGSGSDVANQVKTILPLDHYTSTSGDFVKTIASYTDPNGEPYYISPSCQSKAETADDRIPFYNVHRQYSVASGVVNSAGTAMSTKAYSTSGGTNIQYGLYQGMNILYNQYSTEIANVTNGTNNEISKNIPVVFLITDGLPSHKEYNEYDVLTTQKSTTNSINNMINTVHTAMYWKNKIFDLTSNYTKKMPMIFTIGLDLTGAKEKAFLYPSQENLNSTNSSIKSFKKGLVEGPYKNDYMYADGTFVGKDLSMTEIRNSITTSIENVGEKYQLTIEELVSKGYLNEESLVDPRSGDKLKGYVSVKYVRKDNHEVVCAASQDTDYCEYIYNFVEIED